MIGNYGEHWSNPSMINKIFKNLGCVLFLLLFVIVIHDVYASPIFSEQYLSNPTVADEPDGYFEDETNAINLEKVYYKSDGEILDVAIKTHGSQGFDPGNIISYGMLIDSDADYSTGIRGFDYKYHIQWNNGTWNEIYEYLPSYKKESIPMFDIPIENSFDIDDSIAHLNLNLSKIGNPQSYNIVFFTQGYLNHTLYFHDVTSLAIVPPPHFSISVLPTPLDLISGKKQPIRIMVNSELQDHTDIYQHVRTDSSYVNIENIIDNHVFLQNGHVEIPVNLDITEHEGTLYHALFIDLGPWYPTNPNEEDSAIQDPIIRSYDFRNTVDNITLNLLLVSLPVPPLDNTLIIQGVMLIATLTMAGLGIYTFMGNIQSSKEDKKIIHSERIANIFETMLSLVCQKDHYSKELTLRYPEDEDKRPLVKQKLIDPNKDGTITMLDFNTDNIEHLGWALQHIDSYDVLKSKWDSVQTNFNSYNLKSQMLKNKIKTTCLEAIKNNLPEFGPFNGQSGKVYFLDSIALECYDNIEIAIELGVYPAPVQYLGPIEELGGEYQVYGHTQLFASDETFDDEKITSILGSCVIPELTKEYDSLIELHKKIQQDLDNFVVSLDQIVRELKHHGTLIQGNCDHERKAILHFFNFVRS